MMDPFYRIDKSPGRHDAGTQGMRNSRRVFDREGMASEMLDYVVDEFVQVYAGYGFVEEYPAERAYRDAASTASLKAQ